MAQLTSKIHLLHRKTIIASEVERRKLAAFAVVQYLEETENKRNRQNWRKPWIENHDKHGAFPILVREMEMAFLRMSPEQFNEIATKVDPIIQRKDTNFHKAIPSNERLAVTLRFLATGESFKSLSYTFRLGATTIGFIVPETCLAIYEVLKDEYLKMPQTADDWLQISQGFKEKWNFPNTLGAIDGKHIMLQAPPHSGSVFYNYKHFFSIVLMALVDADYKFIYVDIGCNGRISDGGVFSACSLKNALDEKLSEIPQNSQLPGSETDFHVIPHVGR